MSTLEFYSFINITRTVHFTSPKAFENFRYYRNSPLGIQPRSCATISNFFKYSLISLWFSRFSLIIKLYLSLVKQTKYLYFYLSYLLECHLEVYHSNSKSFWCHEIWSHQQILISLMMGSCSINGVGFILFPQLLHKLELDNPIVFTCSFDLSYPIKAPASILRLLECSENLIC